MAFTKKTAKGRLDKYYHLAKEQGYRARSAFKLIQLNQKFTFLENARVLVDLCAAPGGWLQVASKYMPMSKIIVGVDLAPIKPLPGVITIVSDITTAECRRSLQASLSGWKADVVLHDGAPNVGASWDHDAYAQAELVLHSLSLATEILRPGGLFVTKVFRSKDYNALLFIFNTLFRSVEATKPASSRDVSAEIFVVCKDFIAPKRIDPRLLDPKTVFEATSHLQLDGSKFLSESATINILRPEKQTRHRGGYEDDASTMLYKEITLEAFVTATDPVVLLSSTNVIVLPPPQTEKNEVNSKLLSLFSQQLSDVLYSCPKATPSPDIVASCADLRVLGRREFHELLKWRLILRRQMKKFLPSSIKSAPLEIGNDDTELMNEREPADATNQNVIKAMDENDPTIATALLLSIEAKRTKKAKKKVLLKKAKIREKLNLGLAADASLIDAHDQELFSFVGSSLIPFGKIVAPLSDEDDLHKENSSAHEDDQFSVPEDEFGLEDQLEEMYTNYKRRVSRCLPSISDGFDPSMPIDNSIHLDDDSFTKVGDFPNLLFDDEEEEENKSEGDTNIGEEQQHLEANSTGLSKRINLLFTRPTFKTFDSSASEDEENLALQKHHCASSARGRKQSANKKAKTSTNVDIEFVKAVEPFLAKKSLTNADDDNCEINDDELNGSDVEDYKKILSTPRGFSLALALRSHGDENVSHDLLNCNRDAVTAKDAIKDASFNRYAFDDRRTNLPSWFVEDESRHNIPQIPVTAEAIQLAKAQLKTLAARIPKKKLEAKVRERSRALRRLNAQRTKAGTIAASEEMSEAQKRIALSKMHTSRLKSRPLQKKNIVVAHGANKGTKGRPRGVRGRYKMVDARMKKETRAHKKQKRRSGLRR